jgi:endoglucanase
LSTLELPEDDRRIIVTFHYYLPHEFTHQSAPWSSAMDVKDKPWGTEGEVKALSDAFDAALRWSEQEQRPLFIGEFGSYYAAPMDSRELWTSSVRAEAEKRGFSWAYWDFGTDFAVYNLATKEWREPILRALIPAP